MPDIHPINLNPGQLRVPSVDFSWLANLPQTFQQGQANQLKIDEANRKQGALAELSKLNPNDPNFAQQAAALAFKLGDFGAGASLLEHGLKRQGVESYRSGGSILGGVNAPAATPAAPAVAPAQAPAQQAPAQPPVTTNLPLFGRPQSLQGTTAPGGTVAPAIPASVSQASATGGDPVTFARSQLGRGEIPDRAALQDYLKTGGANLDPATLAWCAAFVNASLGHAGIKGTGSNMARSFLNFGSPTTAPKPGDIAVFQRGGPNAATGHVGFYQGRDANGNILVLGGNQGNQVSVAPYPAASLLGYRSVGMPGETGTAGPVGTTSPGTVAASVQGRGPSSYGQGGAAVASAMPQTPMARTQVAALDPSYTPQTSMTDAGPQLPAGVSPAASAAQGAAGPPMQLPNPTPLVPPNISLAALGRPPEGGVGTIGPMGAAAADAMPPQGVQVAQAAQGAPGAYQLPWNFTQPQGAPALPVRPPVQQAPVQRPAVAPQTPPVARGAVSGSPLEHVPVERLVRAATHPYAPEGEKQLALQELKRRSDVQADANKTSTDYNDYLAELRAGTFKGTRLEYEQAKKADVTLKRLYQGVVEDRARRGLPPEPEGGFEQFVKDNKAGTNLTIDQRQQDAEQKGKQERFNTRVEHAMAAGASGFELQRSIGALRELGVKTGAKAAITGWLAERGVKLEGAGEAEAFNSIIDKMTPSQRIPGAGATSDFDAKMMKSGLPSLIRSGLGHEIIMNTYEKLGKNYEARGDLANSYDAGDIDKATFMKELNKLGKEAYQIGVDAVRDARAAEAKRSEPGGGARLSEPPPGTDPGAWAEILKAYPGLAGGKK
jgi:uncharacterized protein (TIGR02594 family)